MDESQLLKGIIEVCVLKIISFGETYGYQIIIDLHDAGFTNVIEGTLYPILTRLEKKELVSCRKAKSPLGPTRKYYKITKDGEHYLEAYIQMYQKLIDHTNHLLFKE